MEEERWNEADAGSDVGQGHHQVTTLRSRSAGEGAGEQKHQSHNQAVDGESFHEGQGQQQGAADLPSASGWRATFRQPDRCGALTDTRAEAARPTARAAAGTEAAEVRSLIRGMRWKCAGTARRAYAPGTRSRRSVARFHPDLREGCRSRGPALLRLSELLRGQPHRCNWRRGWRKSKPESHW